MSETTPDPAPAPAYAKGDIVRCPYTGDYGIVVTVDAGDGFPILARFGDLRIGEYQLPIERADA